MKRSPWGSSNQRAVAAMLLALSTILLSAPADAGVNEWTPVGPEGGFLPTPAVSPSAPEVVYAYVVGELFHSTDGGESWRLVGDQPFPYRTVVVDLEDPSTLYSLVHRGLGKSVDGGESWEATAPLPIADPGNPSFRALAQAPGSPTVLYAGSGHGLFRSTDGGASWERLIEPPIVSVAADPTSPSTIYAASRGGVYKSLDGGETWTLLPDTPEIFSLLVDPLRPATLYGRRIDPSDAFVRSLDGGATWTPIGRPAGGSYDVAVSASGVLYAALGAPSGIVRSADGGLTWQKIVRGLASLGTCCVEAHPSDPDVLYLGTRAGLFRTADGGDTWRPARSGMHRSSVLDLVVDRERPEVLYAATKDVGVQKSVDGGRTWLAAADGLPDALIHVLEALPSDPQTLYAGTTGLYLSTDGGASWNGPINPEPEPPAFFFVYDLAFDPFDERHVMAVGVTGRIFAPLFFFDRSRDGGRTWTREFSPIEFVSAIEVDPSTPGALFIAGLGIARSVDDGETWTEVLRGDISFEERHQISTLAVAPSNPRVLYAGAPLDSYVPNRLWKSVDGGETWFVPSTALHPVSVLDLKVAPGDENTVYAATSEGFYVSRDGAVTWELLGELTRPMAAIELHPLFPRTLYAGSDGYGAYRLTESAGDGCGPGEALCLNGDRFRVEVAWQDFTGRRGVGRPVELTDESGYLWFFDEDNVEVVVKALDGRPVNRHWWIFYASLSNVGYTLQVTDTVTGRVRTYRNPPERFASAGDIEAFPGD